MVIVVAGAATKNASTLGRSVDFVVLLRFIGSICFVGTKYVKNSWHDLRDLLFLKDASFRLTGDDDTQGMNEALNVVPERT